MLSSDSLRMASTLTSQPGDNGSPGKSDGRCSRGVSMSGLSGRAEGGHVKLLQKFVW